MIATKFIEKIIGYQWPIPNKIIDDDLCLYNDSWTHRLAKVSVWIWGRRVWLFKKPVWFKHAQIYVSVGFSIVKYGVILKQIRHPQVYATFVDSILKIQSHIFVCLFDHESFYTDISDCTSPLSSRLFFFMESNLVRRQSINFGSSRNLEVPFLDVFEDLGLVANNLVTPSSVGWPCVPSWVPARQRSPHRRVCCSWSRTCTRLLVNCCRTLFTWLRGLLLVRGCPSSEIIRMLWQVGWCGMVIYMLHHNTIYY